MNENVPCSWVGLQEKDDEKKKWMKKRKEGPLVRNRLEEEKEDKEEKRVGRKGRQKDGLPSRRGGGGGGHYGRGWLMNGLEEDEYEKEGEEI